MTLVIVNLSRGDGINKRIVKTGKEVTKVEIIVLYCKYNYQLGMRLHSPKY